MCAIGTVKQKQYDYWDKGGLGHKINHDKYVTTDVVSLKNNASQKIILSDSIIM